MDQQSDEQFVRSKWDGVSFLRADEWIRGFARGRVVVKHPSFAGAEWILSGNINAPFEFCNALEEAAAWAAAAAFTREREEQIRRVEEEIAFLRGVGHINPCECCGVRDRILAREQTALAELKKGMKP